jgi:DNA-directed RNA polymerase specialized sigma24 family protein
MDRTYPPCACIDLETILISLQRAAEAGDRRALERRFPRLDVALRAERYRLFRGASDLERDELHQALLLRVHRYFAQPSPPPIRQARAWLRTIAQRVELDALRARRTERRRRADCRPESAPPTEHSGVFPRADFLIELEEEARALEAAVEAYAQAAPSGTQARGQIWACYWLRICSEPAPRVARLLAERGLGEPSPQTVWQWARRGQLLIERLAERDADRARAERITERLREAQRAAARAGP